VDEAVAFYARRGGRLDDWWTILHPPYTLWHLSYVAIGAALAPRMDWVAFAGTLGAFLLAVGVAAHALDELHGRPLRTKISGRALGAAAVASLAGAAALGVIGAARASAWWLLLLIPLGVALVLGYNLELGRGRLHTDLWFSLAWGGFPVLVGLAAQVPPLGARTLLVGAAAVAAGTATAAAQRTLSTPARRLRRQVALVDGHAVTTDGERIALTGPLLLLPLETTLRWLCWAMPLFAAALVLRHVPMG
jgi:hypothetical protein